METSHLVKHLVEAGHTFFVGVPDSTLNGLTELLDQNPEVKHYVAANEGIALAIAAGYQLSSGKIPVVYLQNSGLGNMLNPFMSLVHKEVFDMPILFLIGWRGMKDVKDEPQHMPQGRTTEEFLKLMGIEYKIVKTIEDFETSLGKQTEFQKSFAYLFPPKILNHTNPSDDFISVNSTMNLSREQAIEITLRALRSDDILISTTGKLSREIYEKIKTEELDRNLFMNIGSMGHASSIAYGIALTQPKNRVIVFDGDGALQMHLGALCNISNLKNQDFIHILLANGTHASVGGSRIANSELDYTRLFELFNYTNIHEVSTKTELIDKLDRLKDLKGLTSIVIHINNKEHHELGRPSESPIKQKDLFMSRIK
jgi:phosphonopyruvate decarboxylase